MSNPKWTRKKKRVEREEVFNREGHWTREFPARCEPWPVIEQWARDRDFHLVAMRGRRRMYQKGDNASGFLVFLDLREREEGRGMVLQAWIQAGFVARLQRLFLIGPELRLDPTGWAAVRVRRGACRDLNELLTRFRQLQIVGSDQYHLADVDPSTWICLAMLVIPSLVYVAMGASQLELGAGLTNGLLVTLGKRLIPLGVMAAPLLAVHHWLVLRKYPTFWGKFASVTVATLLFSLVSAILVTRTKQEMHAQKVAYHCVYRYEPTHCQALITNLPDKRRAEIMEHLKKIEAAMGTQSAPAVTPATRR